jgi:hypothetical protein
LKYLPRPVFEIQAECLPSGEVRVAVMVGQGLCSQVTEFAPTEPVTLNRWLLNWLLGLSYFEQGHGVWQSVASQAAEAITQWASSGDAHAPVRRFGFLGDKIVVPDDFDQMDASDAFSKPGSQPDDRSSLNGNNKIPAR